MRPQRGERYRAQGQVTLPSLTSRASAAQRGELAFDHLVVLALLASCRGGAPGTGEQEDQRDEDDLAADSNPEVVLPLLGRIVRSLLRVGEQLRIGRRDVLAERDESSLRVADLLAALLKQQQVGRRDRAEVLQRVLGVDDLLAVLL